MSDLDNLITVIVPVYKIKEDYLRCCIDSLLDQGRNDYKIILVDDGSPDNCGAICDEYAAKSNIISVIHQENQGVSVARNNAIKATTTKWLTFVDADDSVENDYVTSLYKVLNGDAYDSDVVMFEYSREFKNSRSEEFLQAVSGFLDAEMLELVRKSTFYKLLVEGRTNPYSVIGIWDKIYRTDFLRENVLYFVPEARKGQDRLFNAEVLNSTSKIYYYHKMLYHYRCWEGSRTNRYDKNVPKLTSIEIKKLQEIVQKHNLQSTAEEFLKCRICTRLYTCMRLYYFHESNEKKLKDKISDIKNLVSAEPYCSALKTVNFNLLSVQERIFVWFVKMKMYRVVYVLVRAKSENKRKKLN